MVFGQMYERSLMERFIDFAVRVNPHPDNEDWQFQESGTNPQDDILKPESSAQSRPKKKKRKPVEFEDLGPLENGKAICLKCNKIFVSMKNARRHFSNIHMADKSDKKFKCAICGNQYHVMDYLKRHLYRKHKIKYRDRGKSSAQSKPKKKERKPLEFRRPEPEDLEPLENGKAICLKCNKTFASLTNASRHFNSIHMTLKNAMKFKCEICGSQFHVLDYLKMHLYRKHKINFQDQSKLPQVSQYTQPSNTGTPKFKEE